MISKTQAYKSSDGKTHPNLEEAQIHELLNVLDSEDCVQAVLKNKDAVLDILTTTAKSRPRARKVNRKKGAADAAVAKPLVKESVRGTP